ncbi:hypothetical protein H0S73_11700 [Microvirga sp. Marseille-Q2068]|uniref:Uncharacterized protein n=1 Tax=Microvirga mediterraneensis TaxID=2754695 RepID=A0A838BN63_9HYPH|nr:hypothetical protein [Microvirga mediterraneensis]MBA1156791.1 hypothetical protein [Microvirga mediterraneensis]
MDEFIAFVCHGDGPAADRIARLEATAEFRRGFLGSAPGDGGIRQINSLLIPNELVSRTEMEKVTGHIAPLHHGEHFMMMEYSSAL